MVLAAIMVLQVSAGVEADQVVHQQPQHQKRLDCDSTEENGKWISITHHTRTYKVRLSVMNDDTPPCVGAVNLEFARLTFDDDNNGEPIQVVNEFHNGEHEASDIQIDWLRLEQNGVVVQVCDQTATATNDDGGGCNDGNYSNGDGPCLGFNSIEGHHRAGDETGSAASTRPTGANLVLRVMPPEPTTIRHSCVSA
jgi:hypothetical protein